MRVTDKGFHSTSSNILRFCFQVLCKHFCIIDSYSYSYYSSLLCLLNLISNLCHLLALNRGLRHVQEEEVDGQGWGGVWWSSGGSQQENWRKCYGSFILTVIMAPDGEDSWQLPTDITSSIWQKVHFRIRQFEGELRVLVSSFGATMTNLSHPWFSQWD